MKINLKLMLILTLTLMIGIFQSASSQLLKERTKDKLEIKADKASIADDRHDLDRLSDLIIRWDDLRKSEPDSPALHEIEKQIADELRRDLKEANREVKQAGKEVTKSKIELLKSKKEVRREAHDGDRDKKAFHDDMHDKRGDRRDVKDDVRDAKKTEEILEQKRNIAIELVDLQKKIDAAGPKGDQAIQHKQKNLLEDYLKLSQKEINMGIRELKEDKQELREDRREHREDRRD